MDARFFRATLVATLAALSLGAGYRTQNFVVDAPTPELAREIAESAEQYRRDLAVEWLNEEMPPWTQPCMVTAQVSPSLGAGGATSFVFDHGEVFGWRMTIQGSRERILDSVLPHEVTHTVFACHFRQALPRWADEGACTTVEHASERMKQQQMLITFLKTGRGIPFSEMFAMKEYPADVIPLYSQGYSLARFLIGQHGKQQFLEFVGSGLNDENWPRAVHEFYHYDNLLALQNAWLDWVKRGSPEPQPAAAQIASAAPKQRAHPGGNLIYRGQSADPPQSQSVAGSTPRRVPGSDAPLVPVPRRSPVQTRGAPAAVAAVESDSTAPEDAWRGDGWRPAGTGRIAAHDAPRSVSPVAPQAESIYLQSARPQGVEKSRQVILEYESSPGQVRKPILDASLGAMPQRR